MYQTATRDAETTATLAQLLEDTREALDSLPTAAYVTARGKQMLFRLSDDYFILVGPEADTPWMELAWVVPALPGDELDWDFKTEDRGTVLLTHFWKHL